MNQYYGQFHEDKYISDFIKNHHLPIHRTVFEAGAYDGILHSNSRYFILRGYKGILVEPQKDICNKLIENSRGLGVEIHNKAIYNGSGDLYLRDHEIKECVKITQDAIGEKCEYATIDEIVNGREIGIMSIDLEGYDTEVISTMKCRPQILIVEGHSIECRKEQIRILNDEYYLAAIFVFNTIWVRNDIAKMFNIEKL